MEPRNYKSGAVETPPEPLESPSAGYPSPGNPASGIPATVPGTYWHYMISEEMRNVIVQAGLTPNYEDLTQFSQAIQSLIISNLLPIGTVLTMGGDIVPNGFFKRNGAEVSRSTYASHWAYVQTVTNLVDQAVKDASPAIYAGYYGTGDGSTTYTLPDDRGDFHRVWDDGRGVDSGRGIGSFQAATVIKDRTNNNGTIYLAETENQVTQSTPNFSSTPTGSGGVNHSVRPRSTAVMSIEKY